MIRFPNSKINLGLYVKEKREDGYHNLESVFYPINCCDALEIISTQDTEITFNTSGLTVKGDANDNLCMKAVKLLQRDFPGIRGLNIYLHKQIPTGAGLGGGSSDAVACLLLLNDMFSLNLQRNDLEKYALELGSDCPFFVNNKPAFVTGRGENIHDIDLSLDQYDILIVHPGIHISTAQAFKELDPTRFTNERRDIREIIKSPVADWKEIILNDFEVPAFKLYPELREIKNKIYSSGALYCSLTGSGSALYGIFNKNDHPTLDLPSHYYLNWI